MVGCYLETHTANISKLKEDKQHQHGSAGTDTVLPFVRM